MKKVTWTDSRGFHHAALLRDNDPEDRPEVGIPLDPPDINRLDWEELRVNLHNTLVDFGLSTWEDVVAQQNAASLSSAILRVFKRPLIGLYRDDGGK